jgi:hypothetical protein
MYNSFPRKQKQQANKHTKNRPTTRNENILSLVVWKDKKTINGDKTLHTKLKIEQHVHTKNRMWTHNTVEG